MGYMHIENLYKHPDFIDPLKHVYMMEKIHGTSAHIEYACKNSLKEYKKNNIECKTISCSDNYVLKFYPGGEKLELFCNLFDKSHLNRVLYEICSENKYLSIKIHGEAYGGKQQKMAATYGPDLKFIVFDIKINDKYYLNVPEAFEMAKILNLEFVHYIKGPCDINILDQQMKENSIQAIRNGMGPGKHREGIVVRPLDETYDSLDRRMIFKHKNQEFCEVKSTRPLGEKLVVLKDSFKIIDEWLTEERFRHVADRLIRDRENKNIVIQDIAKFIELMVEDINRESQGEVEWSQELEREIRKRTGIMFRQIYQSSNKSNNKSPSIDRRLLSVELLSNDPVSNDPVSNDPVSNDPVSNNPVSNDPVSNDPVSNDPVSN